jgi:hypothetical protein
MQTLTVDPNELDAALKRDEAPAEIAVGRDAHQKALTTATKPPQEVTDRQAIERGEDEGVIVHPR